MSKQNYKLGIQLAESRPGTIATFDPEWNEWDIEGTTVGFRGSIFEGELAALLNYARQAKLTTILEPTEDYPC